jgi:hypothetical protein
MLSRQQCWQQLQLQQCQVVVLDDPKYRTGVLLGVVHGWH